MHRKKTGKSESRYGTQICPTLILTLTTVSRGQIGEIRCSEVSFSNVNVLALINPARQIKTAKYERSDEKYDNTD